MTVPLFFLGTHQPGWLNHAKVPLFVSDTRLRVYQTLPVAAAPVAYDSGGFSELQRHGRWTVPPGEYVARLRRYRDEIGQMMWAAPQDWMCEPPIINGGQVGPNRFAGTRQFLDPDGWLTDAQIVREHQIRTIDNYVLLRELAPDLNIKPAVQGWFADDYVRCVDMYWDRAGIDLTREPLVLVGSVCRRQGLDEAGRILTALHAIGVTRLHGLGFKTLGLIRFADLLTSADSLAWSDTARKLHRPAFPQCVGVHKNCANCLTYAMAWRRSVLAAAGADTPHQQTA
ncbi:MAG TPA: hypothetical protein VHX38_00750 [Pseudonocardiaceae bacterium]|jgi:hypothetical protein|nr:hypothetical protein [Pseudonocardiaceae bacterium]